jgi:steroid 5-alpha reductase family enzyme
MLIAEFTGVWAWQLKSKNAGMIDPIWAMSPEAVAVLEPVWIGSIAGEAIADLQLRRSKADNSHRGKVCRADLWRYSRHPDYFFECVHWVASLSLAVGTGPWIIAMFLPPVLMAWLPMRVSGVPMVEAASAKKREDHAGYMRTTDTLIPCPPRHS